MHEARGGARHTPLGAVPCTPCSHAPSKGKGKAAKRIETLRRLSRTPSLTARLPCVGANLEKMASVLEPVSIKTVKLCRGEPTDTLTKYSVRMSLMDTGTWSMPCLPSHDGAHHRQSLE